MYGIKVQYNHAKCLSTLMWWLIRSSECFVTVIFRFSLTWHVNFSKNKKIKMFAWCVDCQGDRTIAGRWQSNLSTAFKWYTLMPMIIKTRVALFHLLIQAQMLYHLSFILAHIDLTFEIVSTKQASQIKSNRQITKILIKTRMQIASPMHCCLICLNAGVA